MASFSIKPPTYFVSRDLELENLKRVWQEVDQACEPRFLFVMGEPGIGKSTLCNQFLIKTARQPKAPMIVSARCDLYSNGYDVIKDIFMQFFERGEGLGLTRKELVQAIIQQAPLWFSILSASPEFAFLYTIAQSLKGAYEHILNKSQPSDKASVNNQFLRILKTVLNTRSVIIFIDDLHNADPSTLSLIESLSFSLDEGRILFLFASRYTAQMADVGSDSRHDEIFKRAITNCISRGALKVDMVEGIDVSKYLAEKYPGLKLPAETLHELIRKTEGHPFFIEKLLSYWESSKILIRRSHRGEDPEWTFSTQGNEILIPDALGGLIESQFTSLAEDLRHLLEVASVEGENFTVQVISSLQSEEAIKIIQKIQVIEDEYRLVKPYRSVPYQRVVLDFYSFFHGFIQEYIYSHKLDKLYKRELHSRIGYIMEQLYAEEEMASIASHLAKHFDKGSQYSKAIRYYLMAAQYEQSQNAWDASQSMCQYGISIAPFVNQNENVTLVNLLETSARGYGATGDYDNVIRQYEKAIDVAIACKDSNQHIAEMCHIVADYLDTQIQYKEARKFINLGFQFLGNTAEDDLLRLWLIAREGRLLGHQKGKRNETIEIYKSVIDQAENMPPGLSRNNLLYETYNYLGPELSLSSAFEEAAAAYKRSAQIAYELGRDQDARSALQNYAFDIIDQGKFEESLEIANQCLQEGLKCGMLEDQAYSLTIMGAAYASMGETALAIQHLREGIDLFDRLGNHWNDCNAYYDLSRAYLGAGELELAYNAAAKCLQTAQQSDIDDIDIYEQGIGYEVLARVLAELEDWVGAEENFKKSIRIMQAEGSLFAKARTQKYFGLALIKKGDTGRGVRLLRTSLSTMKKIKMDYEAGLIREILAQMQ